MNYILCYHFFWQTKRTFFTPCPCRSLCPNELLGAPVCTLSTTKHSALSPSSPWKLVRQLGNIILAKLCHPQLEVLWGGYLHATMAVIREGALPQTSNSRIFRIINLLAPEVFATRQLVSGYISCGRIYSDQLCLKLVLTLFSWILFYVDFWDII